MKKNNFKLILKRFTHWFSSIGSDADNDWKLILSISIVIFIFIIFSSMQTFFLVQSQKETGATIQAKSAAFVDAKGLANVLSKYTARARDYSKLISTTTPLVDPSH